MIALSPDDRGTTVRLGVGEMLSVRLPENAATGYEWQLGGTGDLLELVSHGAAPGTGRIGSGGTAVFVLRAVRAGKAVVHLIQRRGWEGDAPRDEWAITVEVAP